MRNKYSFSLELYNLIRICPEVESALEILMNETPYDLVRFTYVKPNQEVLVQVNSGEITLKKGVFKRWLESLGGWAYGSNFTDGSKIDLTIYKVDSNPNYLSVKVDSFGFRKIYSEKLNLSLANSFPREFMDVGSMVLVTDLDANESTVGFVEDYTPEGYLLVKYLQKRFGNERFGLNREGTWVNVTNSDSNLTIEALE